MDILFEDCLVMSFLQYKDTRGERSEQRLQRNPTAGAVSAFKDRVQYGPVYCCCVCCQAHFRPRVVPLSQLSNLPHLQSFTAVKLPHLFQHLDSAWCCKSCMGSLAKNATPALAEVNALAPTWLQCPDLEQEEHQLMSNKKCPMITLSNLASYQRREVVLLVPTTGSPDSTNLQRMLDSVHHRTTPYILRPKVFQQYVYK